MAQKKLDKKIEGNVVMITALDGEKGPMSFDFLSLPPFIQEKFGPFGLSHKLGDAAAGKKGKEAEEAISKVYDGLMAGDWSVRAPAAPKVSVNEISTNLAKMPEEEQAKVIAALTALGLKIPGITTEVEEPEDDSEE
jgi:hypothetical protein